ncbi:MAG: DNA-binding protein WhiA [Bacilli bacterium]|nr:DNA-binding protein WhiA [Bacilli bacterium]
MSFTATVKNELIGIESIQPEKIAELSAIIRNSAVINEEMKLSTENVAIARYIYQMLKELYDVSVRITVRKGYNFKKNYIYILEVKHNINALLEDTGLLKNSRYQAIPPLYILADEDLKKAYLRGVFLSTGSINDPKTSRYHLEILVGDEPYAQFVSSLLNDFSLNSKVLKRENKYMIYIKEAEKIGDFLRLVKATKAVLYYEDIRIYRDHKNMTNRLNNCEQANVDKMIETASKQAKLIMYLQETNTFDLLDEKVKEASSYRLKYPDISLTELSEIITLETGISITKSGLHHRLKKMEQFAKKLQGKE